MFQIIICVAISTSKGSCSGGAPHPAFLELAEFTSGQALSLKDASEIDRLKNGTVKALEGTTIISMGSSILGKKKRSSGRHSLHRFPIDDSIETLTISIKTTRRNTNGMCCFLELEQAIAMKTLP